MKTKVLLVVIFMTFALIPTFVAAQPLGFEWSCDVIDNNPDSFLLDRIAWQLYWNGTALETPPLEYQMRSFNFTVSTTHNATKSMVVYTNSYPSPMSRFLGNETDHYVNHSYWWATNGVVHASSGPYKTTDNVSGVVENFMWNQSDWYRIYFCGYYYDPYYETHEGDPSVSYGDMYYFYLNVTDEVEQIPPSSPLTLLSDEPLELIRVVAQAMIEVFSIPIRVLNEAIRWVLKGLLSI